MCSENLLKGDHTSDFMSPSKGPDRLKGLQRWPCAIRSVSRANQSEERAKNRLHRHREGNIYFSINIINNVELTTRVKTANEAVLVAHVSLWVGMWNGSFSESVNYV